MEEKLRRVVLSSSDLQQLQLQRPTTKRRCERKRIKGGPSAETARRGGSEEDAGDISKRRSCSVSLRSESNSGGNRLSKWRIA
ncbi:hypothetical protein SRHO_G00267670 [Serrasalmus rhombeus]